MKLYHTAKFHWTKSDWVRHQRLENTIKTKAKKRKENTVQDVQGYLYTRTTTQHKTTQYNTVFKESPFIMDSTLSLMRQSGMHAPALKHQQPLFDVENPTNNDVLCGRGVTTNRHTGNVNFRSLVNCNKVRFQIFQIFPYISHSVNIACRNFESAEFSCAT